VSVSPRHLTDYTVICDGVAVSVVRFTGRVEFHCPPGTGERVFEVIGTPLGS